MREVKRIDMFTTALNEVWKEHFVDWRFGQFMNNFFSYVVNEKHRDIFFPEEDEMLRYLYEYCEQLKGN